MKVLVQRVLNANVVVDQNVVGQIGHGLLALVGVTHGDDARDVTWLAEKMCHLRIFSDDDHRMNRSLMDVGGSVLLVSQFTLLADCRKGRRPAFTDAALPQHAKELYEAFVQNVKEIGVPVQTGIFAADMQVSLVNDGPVTILLESPSK